MTTKKDIFLHIEYMINFIKITSNDWNIFCNNNIFMFYLQNKFTTFEKVYILCTKVFSQFIVSPTLKYIQCVVNSFPTFWYRLTWIYIEHQKTRHVAVQSFFLYHTWDKTNFISRWKNLKCALFVIHKLKPRNENS